MVNQITWERFKIYNQDSRGIQYKFEDLCRQLFINENLAYNEPFRYLHSNPNNPGLETEPIYDEKNKRRIGFQVKFFEGNVDYTQILKSVKQIIVHYTGKVDHVFLFCNKSLDVKAKGFKDAHMLLQEQNIVLEPIANDSILDLVRKYPNLGLYYFGCHTITTEWFEKHTQVVFRELGARYNREFNIDTNISTQLSLFLHDQDAVEYVNKKKAMLLQKAKELYRNDFSDCAYHQSITTAVKNLQDVHAENIFDAFKWKESIEGSIQADCSQLLDRRELLLKEIEEKAQDKESLNNLRLKVQYIDELLKLPDMLSISDKEKALLTEKILFIDGKAGTGKSQLLANETDKLIKAHRKALLLLAGDYLSDNPIQEQIMKNLSLEFSVDELVDILEAAAEAEGHIIPILIDALNETWIRKVWKIGIDSIITKIKRAPMVKLVLTYRPEYEKELFPSCVEEYAKNEGVVKLHHWGLIDNSIPAITQFLNHYDIPFTPSTLFSYEMTNPLFLTLYCKTYNGEEVDLPSLYEKLIDQVNANIFENNEKELIPKGYTESNNKLETLINELSEALMDEKSKYISRAKFCNLNYWKNYGFTPAVFGNFLIQEQILHAIVIDGEEYFCFAYDQMNDYYCAKAIFKKYPDENDVRRYLSEHVLGIKDGKVEHFGNVDLFVNACALYAELYSRECIDIIDALEEDEKREIFSRYIASFQWRNKQFLPERSFYNLLRKYPFEVDAVWEMFISNSVKMLHPFNADYLHKLLLRLDLNQRDYSWTLFINKLTYEESDRVMQLVALYEQGDKLTMNIDKQAELLLTLFAWLLTSSNRFIRDNASKAMIEILKEKFSICKIILGKFGTVNDPYVIQRLYGVVFGACCKKTNDCASEFQELTCYVYHAIFNQEMVYSDILLRDYARLIIERYFFEYPDAEIGIERSKITPPYTSEPIPAIDDQHYLDDEYNAGISLLLWSMRFEGMGMYGDFGRYVFQSALRCFDVDDKMIFNYAIYYILNKLCYKEELFGANDRACENYDRHQTKKIERIGKKYQWIAMYNILARVSDHYRMLDRYNIREKRVIPYEGAWEPYVRDFDPTVNKNFMKCNAAPKFACLDTFSAKSHEENNKIESSAKEDMMAWLESEGRYFCALKDILLLTDATDTKWVTLKKYCDTGRENLARDKLHIWSWLYAYFVTEEQEAAFADCSKKGLSVINDRIASHYEAYTLYNREYPWAPNYKGLEEFAWVDACVKTGEVETVIEKVPDILINLKFIGNFHASDGTDNENSKSLEPSVTKDVYKEIVRTKDIEKEIGKILHATMTISCGSEYDASSGELTSWEVPCAKLIKDLKLKQMSEDGFYYDENGNLAAFDTEITQKNNGVVIRKDLIDSFLHKNNLKLIWLVQAQKEIHNEDESVSDWSDWEAVFSYVGEGIDGEVRRIQKHII